MHLKAPDGTPMANVTPTPPHELGLDHMESFGGSTGDFSMTMPFTAAPAG